MNCKKITQQLCSKLRIGHAKTGDVLLSHKGSIGFVALLNDEFENVMLTPQVTYYRLNPSGIIENTYLATFFKSEIFQTAFRGLAKQSTRDYIGITAQQEFYIAFPKDPEEQFRISKKLLSLEEHINSLKRQHEKLYALKTGLMHDLLTGEVLVSESKVDSDQILGAVA